MLILLQNDCLGVIHKVTLLAHCKKHGVRRRSTICRVIRNDCRGFNNLSYTIHL